MKTAGSKNLFCLDAVSHLVARFPLTLTLSRGERGQPLDAFENFANRGAEFSRGLAEKLGAFLPLPLGEGRGEGKPTNQNSRLENLL
jgi:hypothetical protein